MLWKIVSIFVIFQILNVESLFWSVGTINNSSVLLYNETFNYPAIPGQNRTYSRSLTFNVPIGGISVTRLMGDITVDAGGLDQKFINFTTSSLLGGALSTGIWVYHNAAVQQNISIFLMAISALISLFYVCPKIM
ncbi:hypothetical protein ACKWTF_000146 [Chironomus riparius]